jgi:hypothetical protein
MSIAIEGNDARRVTATLLGEPAVQALHATNGQWDLLAELQVATLPELARALERIRLDQGISHLKPASTWRRCAPRPAPPQHRPQIADWQLQAFFPRKIVCRTIPTVHSKLLFS